jgi:putative glycosyltransferase
MASSTVRLSIVASMYRSELVIEEFVQRITKSARKTTDSYEIVLVNDGCPSKSLQVALSVVENHPNIKLVDLSRNFGHHAAMMAGLSQASGTYIYLTNIDLEERPENLEQIWTVFQDFERENADGKNPVDVVYGRESERKGSFSKRVLGRGFYHLFNYLSDIDLPRGQIVSRIMTRRYVDALLQFGERDIFMPALWELAGFTQMPTPLEREAPTQPTTYNLLRRIDLAVRALTSFSSKPLVMIFYAGLMISAASGIVVAALVIRRMFGGLLEGWTSVVTLIFLMGGLIIFSIGVVGIYLSRMFLEIKARPVHIIRSIRTSAHDQDPAQFVAGDKANG